MLSRIILNAKLALFGVASNKVRAFLTGLGILFGVGAVICMLAIGTGARQSILDQLSLIGTNNIIVTAIDPTEIEEEDEESNGEDTGSKFSPGLNQGDLINLSEVLSNIEAISPEVESSARTIYEGRMLNARVIGTNNDFFSINNLRFHTGSPFSEKHITNAAPVAIIGQEVATFFFQNENPIGRFIKSNNNWLQIVGVLESRTFNESLNESFGIRDVNADIYIPLETYLLRFQNRGAIKASDIDNRGRRRGGTRNYHQLDKITVKLEDSDRLNATAGVISRILQRRHNDHQDFRIEIPELLLEQQKQTQDTFNLVLAVIAAISLLVGGIGIMNIMLASVMERTREIGIRRAVGATGQDIRMQFLLEAVFISLFGGLLGIGFGIGAAEIITSYTDIEAIVTIWSIALSFGVATAIGLAFGYFPASRAAESDPITALRTE